MLLWVLSGLIFGFIFFCVFSRSVLFVWFITSCPSAWRPASSECSFRHGPITLVCNKPSWWMRRLSAPQHDKKTQHASLSLSVQPAAILSTFFLPPCPIFLHSVLCIFKLPNASFNCPMFYLRTALHFPCILPLSFMFFRRFGSFFTPSRPQYRTVPLAGIHPDEHSTWLTSDPGKCE